jgi:hypothetical protein
MIVIDNSLSANTLTFTLTESLNEYSFSANTGQTFYFTLTNDYTPSVVEQFSLQDESLNPWRFNQFTFNPIPFDFQTGTWSYKVEFDAYDSGFILEVGRILVK